MKEIQLANGMFVQVDDSDYELVSQYNWWAEKHSDVYYARANINGHRVYMHRLILKPPDNMETDHRNGNGLDNRRCNIRIASSSENKCNRGKRSDNISGYKGVYFHHRGTSPWRAYIKLHGKINVIGYFPSPEEAARAYDRVAKELHGRFANLNFNDA